ncbi:MAG: DNA polymerase IV [candidate division NC10 bacterium]|nr:DNA polymerase IV [candidate division NC10 bacterium]
MPGRKIIHVDMDAFFASIEEMDNPSYKGKPVIVGADPKKGKGRGVVSACSYEARKFGIHSAMPISWAYRLCPQGIYLPVRMERYQEVSERIFQILGRYTDLVEPVSIDEAFLDVTGATRLFGPAEEIAKRIKEEIRHGLGLVASVGVASNKFTAKVASDLGKPDGFVVVKEGEERAFLEDLPLSRLWGVGPKTEERLKALGLKTIGELARKPEVELVSTFGKLGSHLWRLSNGIDDSPVTPEAEVRSIGAETTFEEDTDDPAFLRRTLLQLSDRVAERLRGEGYKGRTVTLKLRYQDFTTLTRSFTLPGPISAGSDVYREALKLLEKIPLASRRVRLLGVSVSKLEALAQESPGQLPLFPVGDRKGRLEGAVDAIRSRFGEEAIGRASLPVPARQTGVSRPRRKKG